MKSYHFAILNGAVSIFFFIFSGWLAALPCGTLAIYFAYTGWSEQ